MSGGMKLWRLRRRLRRAPDDGEARLALLAALLEAGERDEARAVALEGVEGALPPHVRLRLADALADLDALESAARAWRSVWHEAPDLPGAAVAWGRYLCSVRRCPEAIEPLRRALAIDPDHGPAREALLDVLRATGAIGEIAETLRDWVERDPEDAGLLLAWGRALMDIGQPKAGVEALRRAHRLRPDGQTSVALGVALGRTGASREAVVLFEQYMTEHPDSLSAQINCGVAYGEIGDSITAVRYLLDASRRAPHLAVIHQNLAVTFSRMGQLDSAVDALRLAARIEPRSARIQLQLAQALAQRGDLHEAMAAASISASLADDEVHTEVAASELRSTLMQSITGEHPALRTSEFEGLDRSRAMSGDVMQFPLPNLLEFLRAERRSGLLQIVSINGVGEIRIRDGDITSVSASQVPRLGEVLIELGHLTTAALSQALGSRPADMPLGMYLVQSGVVTSAQIGAAAREQALRGLMELLPWEQGNFAFMSEGGPTVTESWPTQGLLLDALRRLDEEGYEDAAGSIELVGELFNDSEPSPDIF